MSRTLSTRTAVPRLRAVAIAALASGLLACGAPRVSAADSGVSGTVTVSPTRPGPQYPGETAAAPVAGAEVRLRDTSGTIIARAFADPSGQFLILAPAGQYDLDIETGGALYPKCRVQRVRVVAGQIAKADIPCDSGMR